MAPENTPHDPANQQPPAQTPTEQLKERRDAVDWAYGLAAKGLGITSATLALGTLGWHTIEARSVDTAANIKGQIASVVSDYPYYDQAVGECLLIPEGRTIVGKARNLDDVCMRGRKEADAIKSQGERYFLEVGGFTIVSGIGISLARRRSRANYNIAIEKSILNDHSS